MTWTLSCSACHTPRESLDNATTCAACGQPLFASYAPVPRDHTFPARWDMWRYAAWLPLHVGEAPVTLGEGLTPLIDAPALAQSLGVRRLRIKDESQNPTGSFKARGMSATVTRAKGDKVPGLVVPTAGNAGAALAAYAAAAGIPVRVFAPKTTPRPILDTIDAMGAQLVRIDGHIGDAGKMAAAYAAESGWRPVATLREPYRVEGMKTMGFELAEQCDWSLPDVVVYPTGGGEGTVGIWKAINELKNSGWLAEHTKQPQYVVAQSAGCAPIARAFNAGADHADPWIDPETYASGLRVPTPLGDRILLRILRETQGHAASVSDDTMRIATRQLAEHTGIDAA
ncbi:MAG: threonine synthase, partial [Burkholderiaceae bacterium]|nr:threonine synthase [Burkholderiaceae bacterium]